MIQDLPSDWSQTTLGECADWYSGGTPKKSNPAHWNGTIPWFSARSLREFYIRDSPEQVTELGVQRGARLVPARTVLMLVRGMSLKTELRMGITRRPVTFNQDIKALCARPPLLPEFLAYAIKAQSQRILEMVDDAGHGTGRLPTRLLERLPIPVPPVDEQRRITHLLGLLDDKIELERDISRDLEALVHALYRAWFIDFEGEPDDLRIESPLGPIPPGFSVRPLSEILDINPRVEIPRGAHVPYIEMKGLSTRGMSIDGRAERPYRGSGARFQAWDVLLARISPCLENGKTGCVHFLEPGQVGFGSTEFIVLRGRPAHFHHFGYCLARSERFRHYLVAHLSGSTGRQRVPTLCVEQYRVAVPGAERMRRFEALVTPLFERIAVNHEEIMALVELRDDLVPRLVSGQMRLSPTPDAEPS